MFSSGAPSEPSRPRAGSRRRGLRFKIIAWSFVPTAIVLVAVGLVSFYAFQRTTRYLLIERNRELVRLMAAQLSVELDEYAETLVDLTGSAAFSNRNPAVQQALLKQASGSLVIFDGGVIVTDEHGVVVAAQPERAEIIGQDWSDRSYFRELIRTREPVFSDIVADGPGGAESILIAVPVTDIRNEFVGMAAGMFRLGATNVSSFYGTIVKLRIGGGDYAHLNAYLVDRQGQVIYHSDSDNIGADFTGLKPVLHFIRGEFVDEFSALVPGQGGFSGNGGALRAVDVQGRDVVAYYAAVPGTHWGLVSEASWSGLLSFYRGYLSIQTLLFVLGVIVPALVVGFGIRWITEPIYRLMEAAREVAEGKFGQVIQVKTGDELEELVDQFNHMSLQLSQSYSAIREREERLSLVMRSTNDGIWDYNLLTGEAYYSPRWKGMLGYADHEIGNCFEDWQRLLHPEDRQRALAELEAHLESGEPLYQNEHRLRHRDGDYRWILARAVTLRDEDGKPLRMVGSHSDITMRKQAEDALRKANETLEMRVEERTRRLATLNAISALVNSSLDLDEILSRALDKTLAIMDMEFGGAYRVEGEREDQWLAPDEAAGLDSGHIFLNPLVYQGLSGPAVRSLERISLAEAGVAAMDAIEAPRAWNVRSSALERDLKQGLLSEGVEQILTIPLLVKGRLVGLLLLGTRTARTFTPEELSLLAAIGQQVGVAVENARLHEAVQQTATLEERARLARELHDSVTQSLYSVTLLAEAVARLLNAGEQQAAVEYLRELRDTAQESLREMRLLIFELRPVALEKSGLVDALRLRLEAVETRSGIKTELLVEGVEELTYSQKMELYQIAQESLNNILKHARATAVRIHIQFRDGVTCLEVMDDGVGFDPEQAAKFGGLGMEGMAERAAKIGARLQIESAPGRGTRVRVEVGGTEGTEGTEGN